MKMTWSVVALVGLGIVAALSAAVFTASLSASKIAEANPLKEKEVSFLVVAKDIESMSPLTADSIAVKTVMESDAPAGFFTEPSQIIGKRVSLDMFEGQAFAPSSFPAEGSGAFLAAQLPAGKRAVNIQLSSYESMQGLLYPGSVVDVLASFKVPGNGSMGKAVSTTLLQNIEVMAVANEVVGATPREEAEERGYKSQNTGPMVTLLVDSKQAEALQLAMKHGQISLAMRNPSDNEEIDQDATLLSEGRLAQLAEMLGTSVGEDRESTMEAKALTPNVSLGNSEVAPEPVKPVKKSAAMMRVEVVRGLQLESRSFQLSDN